MTLLSIEGIELNMPNSHIDEVWHNLLYDKKEYSNFSIEFGNHIPNSDKQIIILI